MEYISKTNKINTLKYIKIKQYMYQNQMEYNTLKYIRIK